MRINSANIILTNACNLKCKHCYLKKDEEVRFVEFKDVNIIFEYLSQNCVKNIVWSGGEPLLHPNIYNILKRAEELNFNSWIFTNGTLINEEFIDKVKPLIKGIYLSIDGIGNIHDQCREKKGAFNKITNTLKLLNNYEIPFEICATIYKDNYNQVENIIDYGLKYNCDRYTINAVSPIGNADGMASLTVNELNCLREWMLKIIKKHNYHINIKTNIMNINELHLNKSIIYENIKNSIWIDYDLKVSDVPNFLNKFKITDNELINISLDENIFNRIIKNILCLKEETFNFDYYFEKFRIKGENDV